MMTYRTNVKTFTGVEERPRKSRDNVWTPREVAHSIAIDWLRAACEGKTRDLDAFGLSPSAEKRARRQIAVLHNRLLAQSGLDGVEIDINW